MKIGLIGLGDIAEKAYLPVLSRKENIHLHLYTRKQNVLLRIGKQYRINSLHDSLNSLIESGVKGAFVHVSTEAHFKIVKQLLENDIHVYVDKPVTSSLKSTKILLDLAKKRNLNGWF